MLSRADSELLKAVGTGSVSDVRYSLRRGGNVGIRDPKTGYTLIQIANDGGFHNVVKILQEAGSSTAELEKNKPQEAPNEKDPSRKDICEYFQGHILHWNDGVGHNSEFSVYDTLYGKALEKSRLQYESQYQDRERKKFSNETVVKSTEKPREKWKKPQIREIKEQRATTQGPLDAPCKPKRWIHLPANNRCWVEHLIEKLSAEDDKKQVDCNTIKRFIDDSFFEHRREDPGSCFRQPLLYTHPTNNHMVSFVIPFIDGETKRLVGIEDNTVERYEFRSLLEIDKVDEKKRNEDAQAIYKRQKYMSFLERDKGYKDKLHVAQRLGRVYRDEGRNGSLDQVALRENENTANKQELAILMMKQLWLWMIDERTIITCSPVRFDTRNTNTLQGNIIRDLNTCYSFTLEDFLQHIVFRTIDYIEDPSKAGLYDPCFLVFSNRIDLLASEISGLYKDFEKSIEARKKTLEPANVKDEYDILISARRIHDEIRELKPIFDDQHAMTRRLTRWSKRRNQSDQGAEDLVKPWEEMVASEKTEILNQRIQRLDEDTHRVIKSVQTLLSIKQQQASLDMAASAQLQGIVMAMFAAVTILFAPISFVGVLLTIPDKDARVNSDGGSLSKSMVIAELATFLALLLGFLTCTKPGHKWIRIIPGTGLAGGGLQKLRRIVGSLQNDKWEVNPPKDLESQSDNSSFYDS